MTNSLAIAARKTVEQEHVSTVATIHEMRRVLAFVDRTLAAQSAALVSAGNAAIDAQNMKQPQTR